jgi:7-carboxy-7-deazaguanine synthase
MTYSVKEIFYTLQGEGLNAGRPAVFCRFAGCNLWSGREADRATAVCRFCDTDFVGTDGTLGGKYADADALADAIAGCWPDGIAGCGPGAGSEPGAGRRPGEVADGAATTGAGPFFTVLTGGEPLLQLDPALIDALHARGFQIAVESNGTVPAPPGIDWLCISPKAGAPLVQTTGQELKVVVPQPQLDLDALAALPFAHRLLQPMDGPLLRENTRIAVQRCLNDPRWRLSVQTHKVLGIR